MNWHFENPAALEQLGTSLESWRGTPFMQDTCRKGEGVDCVRLVREVYRDCGVDVAAAEDIPRYRLQWGIHQKESQVLGWLLENAAARRRFAFIHTDQPWMSGDLVAVRASQSVHHIGIIGTSLREVWHVDIPSGVTCLDWEAVKGFLKIVGIFRLRA